MLLEANFNPHPPVDIRGANLAHAVGQDYIAKYGAWMQEAARDLIKKCDQDNKRFTSGSLGSVWMDVSLTGNLPDGTPKLLLSTPSTPRCWLARDTLYAPRTNRNSSR